MEKMNILGIGAHPDDLEICCGGTLVKYAKLGHNVSMACTTNGELGHNNIEPIELDKIRKNEAKNAASVIDAKSIWMGLSDGMLFDDRDTRLKVIDVIREAEADVIITHSKGDYHPDHNTVSELVFAASLLSTLPNIKTQHQPVKKMPIVYYMDTSMGVGFQPKEFVDISEVMEQKLNAISQHKSQFRWLGERKGIDMVECSRIISRFRGLQAGVNYAEGFRTSARRAYTLRRKLLP